MFYSIVSLILVVSHILTCRADLDLLGTSVGCFVYDANISALHNEVTNASDTVDSCVGGCLISYYRYALMWNATHCFCDSEYMKFGDGNCTKACVGNSSQICGGEDSFSVYDTGQRLPGPPSSLELLNVTETSLHIQWTQPIVTNGIISNYSIIARPVSTYVSTTSLASFQSWLYPSTITKTELLDLYPGTLYNVSVAAISNKRAGIYISDKYWTEIGEPSPPPTPEILKITGGQMVIRLSPAINDNGPITAYHVVVISGDEGLASFNPELLNTYSESMKVGLSYYIAAELQNDRLKAGADNTFVVGDGRIYGKYYNPPLPPDAHVHVSLGVVSSLNGITKVKYADITHEQDGIVVLNVGNNMVIENSTGLEVGLSAAVGVFGTLLVLSLVVFLVLRKKVRQQARRTPEQQELSLEGPIFEVEPSSGYVHNSFIPEEVEERIDHYKKLKERVWNVPRNFLDIHTSVMGNGRYGNVMKGTVQQRGFPVPVAVHIIPDGEMIPAEKHAMLQDLGTLIHSGGGDTPNVIQLVGICESPETLFVMVEHHPASLKDMLLESRSLNHKTYNEDSEHPRVCSLPERQLLEAATGIARAMDHLSRQKIIHKQIASRNILMAHGVVPKLTAFGIAQFNKVNDTPDYTRWTAQEIFRSGRFVSKSDVWSFGCLLWEIAALGGTPYADVGSVEVGARVMRGLRLPQLRLVSDDLYQLMLQCWQVDVDERPSFQELACVLEYLLDDSGVNLNFILYPGFHYELYAPELEKL